MILMIININLINSSYIPLLTVEEIVSEIDKINDTYTVEQMNTIKHLYSSQLEIYSIINTVINIEYDDVNERRYLSDLLNVTINDIRYNDLKLPFIKSTLLDAISTDDVASLFVVVDDSLQDAPSIPSMKRMRETENDSTENVSKIAKTDNVLNESTGFTVPKNSKKRFLNTANENINPNKNYNLYKYARLDDFGQERNNFNQMILGFGGGSIKNRRKHTNKTRNNKKKNKKERNKKGTIKRFNYKGFPFLTKELDTFKKQILKAYEDGINDI